MSPPLLPAVSLGCLDGAPDHLGSMIAPVRQAAFRAAGDFANV
jgi:hypothetical protein